jgi:hypothetical protein
MLTKIYRYYSITFDVDMKRMDYSLCFTKLYMVLEQRRWVTSIPITEVGRAYLKNCHANYN